MNYIEIPGLSKSYAENNYLRLDCSNDPLIGNLAIEKTTPILELYNSNNSIGILDQIGIFETKFKDNTGAKVDGCSFGSVLLDNTAGSEYDFFQITNIGNGTRYTILKTLDLNFIGTNALGLFLGEDGDTRDFYLSSQCAGNFYIQNASEDKDIKFYINDGGVNTEILRLEGATSNSIFYYNVNCPTLYIGTGGSLTSLDTNNSEWSAGARWNGTNWISTNATSQTKFDQDDGGYYFYTATGYPVGNIISSWLSVGKWIDEGIFVGDNERINGKILFRNTATGTTDRAYITTDANANLILSAEKTGALIKFNSEIGTCGEVDDTGNFNLNYSLAVTNIIMGQGRHHFFGGYADEQYALDFHTTFLDTLSLGKTGIFCAQDSERIRYGSNFFWKSDSSFRAIMTGTAEKIEMTTGFWSYANAPSVTAGSTLTFTNRLIIAADGELQLPTATATGQGLLIGGDTELYRISANVLYTPDTFKAGGFQSSDGTAGATATFNILDGDGITTHTLVFKDGLFISHSTA